MRLFSIIALCLACLASQAQTQSYQINIKEFTELTVATNINVIYKSVPDSAGIATFETVPEKASVITFANDKGKLKIHSESDQQDIQLPTVTVYSLALTKVTNWGDSTITIANNNPGATFKAKIIGNGHIEAPNIWSTRVEASVEAGNGHVFLSGKAQSAKFSIVSAGTIAAGNLEAAEIKCVMMGTGSVDCYATTKLKVYAAGSGKVYYRGNPTIKKYGVGVELVHIDE